MQGNNMLENAIMLHKSGNFKRAEKYYIKILEDDPSNPDAAHLLGLIKFQCGDLDRGKEMIVRAIELNSTNPDFHANLGRVLHAKGHYQEAVKAFNKALFLDPLNTANHSDLASTLLAIGNYSAAEIAAQNAIALEPNTANALLTLGLSIIEKNSNQAKIHLKKAQKLNPDLAGSHLGLGIIFQNEGDLNSAKTSYLEALKLDNRLIEGHCNLGNVYRDTGEIKKAVSHYFEAITIGSQKAEIFGNLAVALMELGQLKSAIEFFEKAKNINPAIPEIRRNHAMALLKSGQLEEGFTEYNWRWETSEFSALRREWKVPQWDSSQLYGKRILIHAEQGYGDVIQFCRYIPLLAKLGAEVFLECPSPLTKLMRTLVGVGDVVEHRESIDEYDFHLPILNLPIHFRTSLETVPKRVPYFIFPEDEIKENRLQYNEVRNLNVGIVWKGNPKHRNNLNRSPGLKPLSPLFDLPNINFFALEKLGAKEELRTMGLENRIVDLGTDFVDFFDTAVAIKKLDVVITPDTAVAHLAGALNIPVWTILPLVSEWRWLEDAENSPWYPSMRLFRQSVNGAWEGPVARICLALKSLYKTINNNV